MARDFDGVDDELTLGSDATIDDYSAITLGMWFVQDTGGFQRAMVKCDASNANGWTLIPRHQTVGVGNVFYILRDFSTTDGDWYVNTSLTAGQRYHLVVTHDGTTSAPSFYIDGTLQTTATRTSPSGSLVSDAAQTLRWGQNEGGIGDFDGRLAFAFIHNAVLTAADVNRAKWWGRPIGGLKIYHPLMTDKLNNEGTATANATATGTTVSAALVTPVQRPGSAMLGFGVGW